MAATAKLRTNPIDVSLRWAVMPNGTPISASVKQAIENEKRYEAIVGGKRYYVLEKRYAIFPQRSGELVIPREIFNGSRGRGGIFSRKQAVSAVSESHSIKLTATRNHSKK